jgi:hypothetical protein
MVEFGGEIPTVLCVFSVIPNVFRARTNPSPADKGLDAGLPH